MGLRKILIVCAVIFILCCITSATAEEMSVKPIRAEFVPGNYEEFAPIDDGTKPVIHTPIMDIYFWKTRVMSFIDSYFESTSYHEFVRLEIIPFLSILLGSLPFIIAFSRKKTLCSTAVKILSFLKENPVSSESTIIRGVGKSRGAVSYQLHCLLFDGQIHAAEIFGKTYYSTSPISQKSSETALHLLKNNKTRSAIFTYICEHPGATRKELSDALSLAPDTVRYHLRNLESGFIRKERVGEEETYTAEEWVNGGVP